jgi:hypothetical protein
MRQLAQTFAGTAGGPPLYVTLFTEFQTYPCKDNAFNADAQTADRDMYSCHIESGWPSLALKLKLSLPMFMPLADRDRVVAGVRCCCQRRADDPGAVAQLRRHDRRAQRQQRQEPCMIFVDAAPLKQADHASDQRLQRSIRDGSLFRENTAAKVGL